MNPSDPLALAAVTCLVFLATVLGYVALGRAADRHRRNAVRLRVQTLVGEWRRFAREGRGARTVRIQARTVTDRLFWSAIELLALELGRREMRVLSEALARSPHVRAERRALRNESPWRRELAARRLGLVHCGDSRRALRRAVEQGPESVAFHAAFSLARQRDGWALRWILEHPGYFASRPSRSRTALLRAFGSAATPILAERLEAGIGDARLERNVIERLGAARHLPCAQTVRTRVGSIDVELRIASVRALSQLDPAEHLDALIGALSDPAWEVRAQAARALGLTGVSDAVPVLATTLADRSWWVRHHSAYALARLGAEGHAALRGEAIASPDRYARDMAREAVEQLSAAVGKVNGNAAGRRVTPIPTRATSTPAVMLTPVPPAKPLAPQKSSAPAKPAKPVSSAPSVAPQSSAASAPTTRPKQATPAPTAKPMIPAESPAPAETASKVPQPAPPTAAPTPPAASVTPEAAAAAPPPAATETPAPAPSAPAEPIASDAPAAPAAPPAETASPALPSRPLRARTPAEITAALRAASRRKRSA